MATAPITRSIQINLGVFTADNGIRRSVGAHSMNYVTANGTANVIYQTMLPGDIYTYTPQSANSVLTLNVSGPVKVDVNYNAVLTGPLTRAAGSYSQIVNQMLVLDDSISSIIIHNMGLSDSIRMSLIQG